MTAAVLQAQDLARHYSVSRGLLSGFWGGHTSVKALNGVSFDAAAPAARWRWWANRAAARARWRAS